nr:hypothetical protein CFP56_33138 [Quercus suber]
MINNCGDATTGKAAVARDIAVVDGDGGVGDRWLMGWRWLSANMWVSTANGSISTMVDQGAGLGLFKISWGKNLKGTVIFGWLALLMVLLSSGCLRLCCMDRKSTLIPKLT